MDQKEHRFFPIFPQFAFIAVVVLVVVSNVVAATGNLALRTGVNAFFRTDANSATLTPAKTITMEAWIKPTGPGVIFNEVDAFDITRWDQSLAEVTAQGDVVMGMPGIAGAVSVGKVTFGDWSHVILRYNATNGVLNGFVNGQKGAGFLVGNRTFPPAAAYMAFGRTSRTNLGTGGWLSADFDEVRIWNIARSDSDIASTWSSKIQTTAPGLVQNFHLDDGVGTATTPIADAAGFANGVNVGATWVASSLQFAGPPTFGNLTATVLDANNAQLNGTVNPNGVATDYHFEYGTTTSYGTFTATNTLAAQYTDAAVSANVTNLPSGTYNFRLVASNSYAVTASSNATFTLTNIAGFAVEFPQVNSYVRTYRVTQGFFTNAAITAEFWFEAQPGVLLNEVDAFDVSQWDYSLLEVAPDGRLLAALPGLTNIVVSQLQFGKWYHVAFRYDPTISRLDVFLNGLLTASSNGTRTLPSSVGSQVYICLGRGGPSNLGLGAFYHGKIDEVRIWRVAVPDAMIAANMNLILSGQDPNLFADWSFESLSGDLSPDKSPDNNPALFINGPDLAVSLADLKLDLRPTAVTGTVQDSFSNGSVLNGSVISGSTNTVAYFIYGAGALTNATSPVLVGDGSNSVQMTLNGLLGGTNYSVALVASNEFGISQGATVSFVKLGWAGYALTLATNSYIRTINDQHAFFTDETITVSLWVKPAKAGVVMSETDRVSPPQLDSSLIEILSSGTVVAGFPGVPTIVLGDINFNAWNNIILRYNKSTQTMDGFVNGVKSSNTSTGDRVAGWEIGRQIIYTFGKATTDKIGTGEALGGQWDEIELWSIARTDADILATYNKKLLGTEAGLVAYYRFDDQSGVLTDSSRHNNTGGIQGPSAFAVSSAPIDVAFNPIEGSAGALTIQFIGIPGREMRLESTTDFQTWTSGPSAIVNSIGIATFTVSQDSQMKFFRAKQL